MTVRVTTLSGLGTSAPTDLSFCGPVCWGGHVVDKVKDVYGAGEDAFDYLLDFLPDDVAKAIRLQKKITLLPWVISVKAAKLSGKMAYSVISGQENLINAFNAAYDGVIEIGKDALEDMSDACALFREYKAYINIGIQVAQQDYANAAANLAEEAAKALDVPVVVQGTDHGVVQLGEFVCQAVDGVRVVSALANGIPVPPPLPPANNLKVENGVARERTASEKYFDSIRPRYELKTDGGLKVAHVPKVYTPRSSSAAPKIIIGAGAVAALIMLSAR